MTGTIKVAENVLVTRSHLVLATLCQPALAILLYAFAMIVYSLKSVSSVPSVGKSTMRQNWRKGTLRS